MGNSFLVFNQAVTTEAFSWSWGTRLKHYIEEK